MNYIGIKCPVCHRPFEAGDDIVVCPICGAPYHRHCYEQAGKCLFEEKHAAGESWSPDAGEDSAEKERADEAVPVLRENERAERAFL